MAREVFVEQGPSAPLSAVASRLGLTQPALSKRFGSKASLLRRALLSPVQSDWVVRLDQGPDERPFPEQLHELCVGAMEVLGEAIPRLLALRVDGLEALREVVGDAELPHERVRRSLVAFFGRAIAAGLVRDVAPEQLAVVVVGSVQARALMAHVAGESLDEAEREAHATAIVGVLWGGMRPEGLSSTRRKQRGR